MSSSSGARRTIVAAALPVLRTSGTVALAYAMLVLALMFFEEKLIYFPERGGRVVAPGKDVWLRTQDGVKLHGFYSEPPGARLTLLYLHGNAGNLAGRSDVITYFAGLGVRVLALDYRGYGQSEGKPTEQGLYADAFAAHQWLLERGPAESIVVLGESLGGGPACELALRRTVGGLVLHSTFTSVPDMAALSFPFLPRIAVRTKFDNLAKVGQISAPKLLVHSRRDEVIPFQMGERLAQGAKAPVRSLWLERSQHNDAYYVEAERLGAALRELFASLPGS
jgi:fermentation-respiration switch protein FrsA (DUF1100 family)